MLNEITKDMSLDIQFEEKIFDNRRREASEFKAISLEVRRDIIKMLGGFMSYDAKNPNLSDRDRFLFSAGHLVPVQYSVLARAGYFPADELKTLRKYGSRLQGHPGLDVHLPGIETASGSLGQGISIAVGMAMSDKLLDILKKLLPHLTNSMIIIKIK